MDIIRSSDSHHPALVLLPFLTPIKRVLELGAGASTKIFINQKIYPDMEQFDSCDNGPENWICAARKSMADTDDRYQFHYSAKSMAEIVSKVDVNLYDLIFIDDSWVAKERAKTIESVTSRIVDESNTIIAIHDFEFRGYKTNVRGGFNQFVFNNVSPHVGVLWKKTRLIPYVLEYHHKLIGIHYKEHEGKWLEWYQFFVENKYQKLKNENEKVDLVKEWYRDPVNWIDSGHGEPDLTMLNIDTMVKGKCVLDLGCHYPSIEMDMADLAKQWTAIDFIPEGIKRSKELCDSAKFICMDMTSLDFDDKSFDTVLDFSSGDQMPEEDYDKAILEVYRVLKTGGYFLVTYSSREFFKKKEEFGKFGYNRYYTTEEMKSKLDSVGFHDIEHFPHFQGRVGIRAKRHG